VGGWLREWAGLGVRDGWEFCVLPGWGMGEGAARLVCLGPMAAATLYGTYTQKDLAESSHVAIPSQAENFVP
jgi:hypothetical protein